MIPEFLEINKIRNQGASDDKIVKYPGLKEGVYLWNYYTKTSDSPKVKNINKRKVIFIRPEPSMAQYYKGRQNFIDDLLVWKSGRMPYHSLFSKPCEKSCKKSQSTEEKLLKKWQPSCSTGEGRNLISGSRAQTMRQNGLQNFDMITTSSCLNSCFLSLDEKIYGQIPKFAKTKNNLGDFLCFIKDCTELWLELVINAVREMLESAHQTHRLSIFSFWSCDEDTGSLSWTRQ